MQNGTSGVLNEFRQGSSETFEAAFETLFHLHQRAVYGWILRIVRNSAAAEDLTIESFWRIHQAHARFEPARGFEGWARRIATHAALDWLRAQPAQSALSMEVCAEVAGSGRGRSGHDGGDYARRPRWPLGGCRRSCGLRPRWR